MSTSTLLTVQAISGASPVFVRNSQGNVCIESLDRVIRDCIAHSKDEAKQLLEGGIFPDRTISISRRLWTGNAWDLFSFDRYRDDRVEPGWRNPKNTTTPYKPKLFHGQNAGSSAVAVYLEGTKPLFNRKVGNWVYPSPTSPIPAAAPTLWNTNTTKAPISEATAAGPTVWNTNTTKAPMSEGTARLYAFMLKGGDFDKGNCVIVHVDTLEMAEEVCAELGKLHETPSVLSAASANSPTTTTTNATTTTAAKTEFVIKDSRGRSGYRVVYESSTENTTDLATHYCRMFYIDGKSKQSGKKIPDTLYVAPPKSQAAFLDVIQRQDRDSTTNKQVRTSSMVAAAGVLYLAHLLGLNYQRIHVRPPQFQQGGFSHIDLVIGPFQGTPSTRLPSYQPDERLTHWDSVAWFSTSPNVPLFTGIGPCAVLFDEYTPVDVNDC